MKRPTKRFVPMKTYTVYYQPAFDQPQSMKMKAVSPKMAVKKAKTILDKDMSLIYNSVYTQAEKCKCCGQEIEGSEVLMSGN